MRRHCLVVIAVGLAICAAEITPARSDPPCLVRPANSAAASTCGQIFLMFEQKVGFSPRELPMKSRAPVAIGLAGKVSSSDGSHTSALREEIVELDKNGAVDATLIPVCSFGQVRQRDTPAVRHMCRGAIVGTGTTLVDIERPGQERKAVRLPLILFNGGVKNGQTTLFIRSSISLATPTALVATVKLTKIQKGRYGLQAIATIPQIAEGYGSVSDYELKLKRRLKGGPAKQTYATAQCLDGHLDARSTAVLADGSRLVGTVVRPCVSEG